MFSLFYFSYAFFPPDLYLVIVLNHYIGRSRSDLPSSHPDEQNEKTDLERQNEQAKRKTNEKERIEKNKRTHIQD